VSLSPLFPSKTNADDGGYIGCSQARARAEYKSSMAGVCARTHTRRTYGEMSIEMRLQNREAALERRMRYTRRRKHVPGVEVVSRKIDESTETTKHRGEELVSAAAGPDFRTAMIDATITGLEDAGAQIQMTCRVVGADRPRAAAPLVAGSCIFGPGLLLGDQALHELGALVLVGFDTFVQQHFTNLRDGPLFLISDLLNVAPQFRVHSEYQKACSRHL
jgi:hypothetical protein